MQNTINLQTSAFGRNGWRYYNIIKKKAMGQEFSFKTGGLAISLSIAFFIVIISAQLLNMTYQSFESSKNQGKIIEEKIYYLEGANRLDMKVPEYQALV
jgi:phage-related holin